MVLIVCLVLKVFGGVSLSDLCIPLKGLLVSSVKSGGVFLKQAVVMVMV